MSTSLIRSWLAVVFLLLCLLLGGASGPGAGAIGNALLQICATFLILFCLWTRPSAGLHPAVRPLLTIGGLFLVVNLIYLVPLPAESWASLPGRERILEGYRLLGLPPPSVPVSLARDNSIASLLWLLPPAAMLLVVLQMSASERAYLPWIVIGVSLISVALGAAQLIGGPGSPLRFYEITNDMSAVGFFSNTNHLATLLLCSLPLLGYLVAQAASTGEFRARQSRVILSGAMAVFLLFGILTTGSIAGYGLILPAAGASFLIYWRAAHRRLTPRWIAAVALLFGLFLALSLFGPLNEQNFQDRLSDDPSSRKAVAAVTVKAIGDHFPFGSGLGTFAEIYRTYEDMERPSIHYMNHAHNDYLELALELGLPGLLLMLGFLLWWGRRVWAVWKGDFKGGALARAGSVITALILFHSIVDYPVRTSAIAALFALGCALMVPGRQRETKRAGGSREEALRHLQSDEF